MAFTHINLGGLYADKKIGMTYRIDAIADHPGLLLWTVVEGPRFLWEPPKPTTYTYDISLLVSLEILNGITGGDYIFDGYPSDA